MNRLNFVIGVALLVVATTMAITITLRSPQESQEVVRESTPAATSVQTPGLAQSSRSGLSAKALRPRTSGDGAAARQFRVSAPDGYPEDSDLARKARQVEAHAKARLAQLTEDLDLRPSQQRKLFPVLARTSSQFDPAMEVSGIPVGSPALTGSAGEAELQQVLESGQKEDLIEKRLKDAALWEEIIGMLQQRLEEQAPDVPAAAPAEPGTTTPIPSSRRRGGSDATPRIP